MNEKNNLKTVVSVGPPRAFEDGWKEAVEEQITAGIAVFGDIAFDYSDETRSWVSYYDGKECFRIEEVLIDWEAVRRVIEQGE